MGHLGLLVLRKGKDNPLGHPWPTGFSHAPLMGEAQGEVGSCSRSSSGQCLLDSWEAGLGSGVGKLGYAPGCEEVRPT